MKDDPKQIAEHLVADHGLDGAKDAVMDRILDASLGVETWRGGEGYLYFGSASMKTIEDQG